MTDWSDQVKTHGRKQKRGREPPGEGLYFLTGWSYVILGPVCLGCISLFYSPWGCEDQGGGLTQGAWEIEAPGPFTPLPFQERCRTKMSARSHSLPLPLLNGLEFCLQLSGRFKNDASLEDTYLFLMVWSLHPVLTISNPFSRALTYYILNRWICRISQMTGCLIL